jgi:hypothetical protein
MSSSNIEVKGEEKKLPSRSEMQFGLCIEIIAKKFISS